MIPLATSNSNILSMMPAMSNINTAPISPPQSHINPFIYSDLAELFSHSDTDVNDTLNSYGFSKDCIREWVEDFRSEFDKNEIIRIFSSEIAWAYIPAFFEPNPKQSEKVDLKKERAAPTKKHIHKYPYKSFTEMTSNYTIHKSTNDSRNVTTFSSKGEYQPSQLIHQFQEVFEIMKNANFWVNEAFHENRVDQLVILYRLYKVVAFLNPEDRIKIILWKLMGYLAERIASNTPDCREKTFFSLPLPHSQGNTTAERKRLCCYKTAQGWRIGDFDLFQGTLMRIAQFNANKTQMLLLEPNCQPLQHRSIVIEAHIRPGQEILPYIVLCHLYIYNGPCGLSQGYDNTRTFAFDILRNIKKSETLLKGNVAPLSDERIPLQIMNFRTVISSEMDPSQNMEDQSMETIKIYAESIFKSFKNEIIRPIAKNPWSSVIIPLTPPCNSTDDLYLLVQLLTELKKDPSANAKEIAYIAQEMDCGFSEEKLEELVKTGKATQSKEGYHVSAEDAVDQLLQVSKKQLSEILITEQVSKEKLGEEPLQRSEPKDTKMSIKQIQATQQLEKAKKKQDFKRNQKKQQKQLTKIQSDLNANNTPSESIFGAKMQEQIHSVYTGQPKTAKNFATFALSLIRQKVKSLGASLQIMAKGSHRKLHIKYPNGSSSGVTIVIPHGKDSHGNLSAQKRTLRQILQF